MSDSHDKVPATYDGDPIANPGLPAHTWRPTDVDQKPLRQLAAELGDLADKARAGKLALSDMQGGTFTLSNQGAIGGTSFTPLVNSPEVAILGLSRARPHFGRVNGRLAFGFARG